MEPLRNEILVKLLVTNRSCITFEGREHNSVKHILHDFKRGVWLLTGESLVLNRKDRQHLHCDVHHPPSVSLLSCC